MAIKPLNKSGPIPPGGMPVEPTSDPYGFGGKVEGYPHGQATAFLHGRTLRDCVFGSAWEHQGPFGPPPFANVFQLPIRNTQKDRALYIKRVHLVSPSEAFTGNGIAIHWLIVADYKQIWGAPVVFMSKTPYERNVGFYIPPRTNVDVYYQFNVGGGGGNNWVVDISVEWIEFDAARDIWPWGNGENKDNPAAADIAVLGWWP